MTPKEKQTYRRLADLTGSKCQTCPELNLSEGKEYRCCDKMFCDLTEKALIEKGIFNYSKPNVGGIPYMTEDGCIIRPEDRPFCSGYVCSINLQDKEFERKYRKLCKAVGLPVVNKLDTTEQINQRLLELLN